MTFRDDELQSALRLRLGLATCFDGPDPFGYRRLAENLGGRTNARHKTLIAAWRQVFLEAGGEVPDRNVERLLRRTNVPVPDGDQRRLDLIVPGLNVARGLPLFCDVTIVSPISRDGRPRPGTSNVGGQILRRAEADNNDTYRPVLNSGLGALFCLGFEVFGRWGRQSIELLPLLARERTRGVHPRLRRGTALGYLTRWSSLISVTLQKAVVAAATRAEGGDLATTLLEPLATVSELPVC